MDYPILRYRKTILIILGLAALVLFVAVTNVGAVEREGMMQGRPMQMEGGPMQMGFEPRWHDPQAWFERGGALEHEADWYDYTFAYRQPGGQGYWGPHGEPLPFGYFGERSLEGSGLHYGQDIELNYYTTDWYNREGALEGWL